MAAMRQHIWFALHDRITLFAEWIVVLCAVSVVLHELGIWRFQ